MSKQNNHKKKTIMIDMDNVITDGIFLDLINEFLKTDYKLENMKTYFLQELIEEYKEEFWNYVKDKNFYKNAPLIKDCYIVLKELQKDYEIYIVTAYIWNESLDLSGNNLKNKYYYLKEKLPFIPIQNYIFTTNKNIMNFDIKIDDRINNLENTNTKILFNAWHNQDISDEELKQNNIIRANSWIEIKDILSKK